MSLLAHSGHPDPLTQCPLSGVKRTWVGHSEMSAFDPKRTCEGVALGRGRACPLDPLSRAGSVPPGRHRTKSAGRCAAGSTELPVGLQYELSYKIMAL